MRLITTADEELYQAVSMAIRFDRAGKLVDHFQKRYEKEWDNPEVSFQYALAMVATLRGVRSDADGFLTQSKALEALGHVLSVAADHWLARYCRARLRALVPTAFRIHGLIVEHERNMANEDLRDLVERQSGVPVLPYFACTHMQLAFVAAQTEDWSAVHGHIEAAGQPPPAPVGWPALGSMLCEPFLAVHSVVDADDRETVGDLMAAMFPDQPAVTAAVHQRGGPEGLGGRHQETGTGAWRS